MKKRVIYLFLFGLLVTLVCGASPAALAAACPLLQETDERETDERETEERETEERETEEQDAEEEEYEEGDDEQDGDEEDGEELSLRGLMEFSEEHVPMVARFIKEVIEEEGENEEVIEYILDRGREMIDGYRDTVEGHGRRMGKKFLELFATNLEIEMVAMELEEGVADQDRIQKHVKLLLARRYSLELLLEKAELNRLKSEVQEFEEEIRSREENRSAILEEQLEEVLSGLGEEEGDEEEEEEEGDDDDDEVVSNLKKKSSLKGVLPVVVSPEEVLATRELDYGKQVLPLFRKGCFDCHGTSNQEGELDLQSLLTDRPLVRNRQKWLHIQEQTRNHVMPPADADPLQESERRKMVAWI
ncbi:MAG: c-type cytochrome domain-containing protein [Planctomycetota bacterium]|nr:c-type cytochrome domain-containing protein [Planctomycetota bacterium]